MHYALCIKEEKIICKLFCSSLNFHYLCTRFRQSGCSAVGSALRSGRRGRAFESPHPDQKKRCENISFLLFIWLLFRFFLLLQHHIIYLCNLPSEPYEVFSEPFLYRRKRQKGVYLSPDRCPVGYRRSLAARPATDDHEDDNSRFHIERSHPNIQDRQWNHGKLSATGRQNRRTIPV